METIKDIMSKHVVSFKENDKVAKIAATMGKKDIGAVVIVKGKKPVGIITERDMVRRVMARNLDTNKTTAKEIMTSPVEYVKPSSNIYFVSKYMSESGYKRYPVVEKNKLVGIVSQTDLMNYFTKQRKKFVMKSLSKSLRRHYPI